jgi:sarcosine oxidase, subunit alpha
VRLRPPLHPVTFTFDGEPVVAERGEPIATALLAADKVTVARSPKFHRPRGPACFRAACDGCLARVDEEPNVMTCMTPAEEGTTVVSQNRLGPREVDLLRMTDWFFPEGLNHHELFAGVPGVQLVMQAFARRVAGLGRLPGEAALPRPARRRAADAVIVGAGPSGMAVASRLAHAGRSVEVVDDQLEAGGGMLACGCEPGFDELRASFMDLVKRDQVTLRPRTIAGGIYGRDLLVVGRDGAEVIEARSLVLACGAHDGVLAFEGNDLPGVMSARAAGFLLGRGVVPGEHLVAVVAEGGGPFGAAYARAFEAAFRDAPRRPTFALVEGEPVRVRGTSRAKSVIVKTREGEKEHRADAVLIDAPRSPAYELAEQAGATLRHEPRGYVADTSGVAGVFAAGELAGCAFDAAALVADAERVVARILG